MSSIKGVPLSEEHRRNLSISALLRVQERKYPFRRGKPDCIDCGKKLVSYTAKRCKKCRTKHDLSGENHWAWKGGISKEYRRIRATNEYAIWRKTVLERDSYTCVICGDHNFKGRGVSVVMQVDHIKPFYLYPDLRFDLDNGRTLCVTCHRKTDTWGRPKKPKR